MTIAVMTMEDVPEVAALERQCFSQPWSAQVLEAELRNPNSVFLAAKEAGRLAGYAGMHRVMDEGYLFNVAVDSGFRRRGIATALVEKLVEFAKEKRMGFLTLEVREGNATAIALYKKLGFGEVGRRKRFYVNPVEDAVLMTKFIQR
ncbi:ribosomal protein S18-alanine N-acetyltransferase [Marasmitruncus massiliensis]|uniref:ribosomal protein S18-alanine N-acetyltransferase n=1 Tax=Marasmitruncus massiliensis TaxID=1944642 RepID=UPI001FA8465D|nr:ribosomal protein S18-alanine N-acetyltransferase [Marasmitruncus massiliensis]